MTFSTAIILIVVAVLAGYVFGIVDSRVTSAVRKKPAEAAPSEQPIVRDSNPPGEHTVLKVNVDRELKWHLEVNGDRLGTPETLTPDQRQKVVNVVVQMRPWLDGKLSQAAPAAVTTAPVMQRPAPTPAPISTPAPSPAIKDELKISGMRGFSSMITKDVKTAVEKKPTSIVGMINDVLQQELPGTPYMGRGISLSEGPQGEVMVHVGSQVYTGIDAVPDPGIRDIIRSAITVWEKK